MYNNYQDFHFDKSKIDKSKNIQNFIFGFVILVLLVLNIAQNINYNSQYHKNMYDNIALQNQKNKLIYTNNVLLLDLENQEDKIKKIDSLNQILNQKIKIQEGLLTQIKTKYEKAKDYSRNYNADSVRRYFTDIQE